jgi:hypothetical protein
MQIERHKELGLLMEVRLDLVEARHAKRDERPLARRQMKGKLSREKVWEARDLEKTPRRD